MPHPDTDVEDMDLKQLLQAIHDIGLKYTDDVCFDVSAEEASEDRARVAILRKLALVRVGELSTKYGVNYTHCPSLQCPYCCGSGQTTLLQEYSALRPCICGLVEPEHIRRAGLILLGIRHGSSGPLIELLKKLQPFVAGGPVDGVLVWLDAVYKS